MSIGYSFEITQKFRGQGKVDEAEDWIRANVKGLWALEFVGMQEEIDDFKKTKTYIFHVRFKFGRSEDFARFKNEYVNGKPPTPTGPRKPTGPAKKKKGLLAKLFG